jgi:hypothetical protein
VRRPGKAMSKPARPVANSHPCFGRYLFCSSIMGFLLPFVAAETSVTGRCVKRLASWQRGPGSRNDRDDLIQFYENA